MKTNSVEEDFCGIISCNKKTDLALVKVKAGIFIMGSLKKELGRYDDEEQHQVTITKDFWLGKYQVTQAQYEAIMGKNPSHFKGKDLPVEDISWYDAKAFCDKLNKKYAGKLLDGYMFDLPTEAQWEYACRAGTITALNNGEDLKKKDKICSDSLKDIAWYAYQGIEETHPVGQKLPNAWGLYDMHGNVWEWCRDYYETYLTDDEVFVSKEHHVFRGGSWRDGVRLCRSAVRNYDSSDQSHNVGFRLAYVPVEDSEYKLRKVIDENVEGKKYNIRNFSLFLLFFMIVLFVVYNNRHEYSKYLLNIFQNESTIEKSKLEIEQTKIIGQEALEEKDLNELIQENYQLQSLVKYKKTLIDSMDFNCRQIFEKYLEQLKNDYVAAEDAFQKNNHKLANIFYKSANEAADWIVDNESIRNEVIELQKQVAKQKEEVEKFECSQHNYKFKKALQCVEKANNDYDLGNFRMAQINLQKALTEYKKVYEESRELTLENLISLIDFAQKSQQWDDVKKFAEKLKVLDPERAQKYLFYAEEKIKQKKLNQEITLALQAKAEKKWENVYKHASVAWMIDSQNKDAIDLKKEAELQLKPTLQIVALVNEKVVPAKVKFDGKEFDTIEVISKDFKINDKYEGKLNYEIKGKEYIGEINFVCNWQGYKELKVHLRKVTNVGVIDCNGVDLELIQIDAGTFVMGSPENELGRNDNEKQHQVILSKDYWLGKYEVTQAQYKAIMGKNPSKFKGDNRPVENVSWHDAKAFCEKLNQKYARKLPEGYQFDLPTEAQWEYACRAGTITALNNGTDLTEIEEQCQNLDELSWYKKNSDSSRGHSIIGKKQPNIWELHDMHGNVLEWCRDGYDVYSDDAIDPIRKIISTERVVRGGSWNMNALGCRSAFRWNMNSKSRKEYIGFRLAFVPIYENEQRLIDLERKFQFGKKAYKEKKYIEAVKWYRHAAEQGHIIAQNNLGGCYYLGQGVSQDYAEAVKWYRQAAEQGHAIAQFSLGHCYAKGNGVSQDYSEAVKWYRQAAEQGHANAQFSLGHCYAKGNGVSQDYSEAVKWYRQAAEQGHAEAQNNLGDCYYNGDGVSQDYSEAVKWYRQAAEQGHDRAQNNLGVCYENGKGVSQDYAEAVKWYRQAAEQGHAEAQNNLGYCYYNGDGVSQDYSEAVKWFRKAAEQGNANAQNNLGFCYENGKGVSQDYAEAVKWYRKAAEQGSDSAQNNLGNCYFLGRGVSQDYAEAVKWYRQAAEQGHAIAQFSLGVCYYSGQGVSQDYAEAVKWFRKAAGQGYANAQYDLGVCYESGRGVEQDYAEAVKWYREAAEQGHANAQNNLGDCYYNGDGVSQDYSEAVKWYRKAAEQGNANAQNNLGVCYENGKGVSQDYAEAVKWYRKAAEQGNKDAIKLLDTLQEKIKILLHGIVDCNGVELKLVKIKAGSFYMGSPKNEGMRSNNEKQHRVTLTKDYWMGQYEVTQAQYEAIMGKNPSILKGDNRPMEQVSWHDAKAFCEKLNQQYAGKLPKGYQFDLPTEAQWEYACRAGTTTAFSYGNDSDVDKMNFAGDYPYGNGKKGIYRRETVDVGSLGYKNAWGLYDMHGNVGEWCRDWYGDYPGDVTDPTGPSDGSRRVFRGGSWGHYAKNCRSACRGLSDPSDYRYTRGFRLALVPVQ